MDSEQLRQEIARLDHADLNREITERLKYQVDFAMSGLKALTLINGGAIVALFTVLGNKGLLVNVAWIWWSFASFSLGLSLSVASTLSAFLSQMFYTYSSTHQMWSKQKEMYGAHPDSGHMDDFRRGKRFETTAIVLAFLSLSGFIVGATGALLAVLPR